MIVVDASALSSALLYADARGTRARAVLKADPEWAAPEHWKAEVFSVVRGLTLGGKLDEDLAQATLRRLPVLGVETVGLDGLLADMWQMRASISGYDAAYVALARARDLTLVTSDARLARAAATLCRLQVP